jgi:hypothetical protein
MEWGKLYASLTDDPRVQAAEADGCAGWLLIESMCYCTSAESDGFIPFTQVDRFGGSTRLKRKVNALVREGLWIPVERGYLLDPEIWSEERNLSDQAEKKREADRRRIAAKRAAAKATQNGRALDPVSRDSRATCSATPEATGSGDSRSVEKSREEKRPVVDVVSHLQTRTGRRPDDDDLISQVVGAFLSRTEHLISGEEAGAIAAKVLGRAGARVANRAAYVVAAIAKETDPWSLLGEPPPLGEILHGTAEPSRSPWCGSCDERTRLLEDDQGRPYRCPECHPKAEAS